MKHISAFLLAFCAVTAHAQDDSHIETHATFLPCPDGPGVAVVADDAQGNESWAGCWGSDPVEFRHHHDDGNHRRRDLRAEQK